MDDMIRDSLAGFGQLWQRVSCAGESAEPGRGADTYSPEDTLLALIHDEICTGAYVSALARMFQGDGRALLQRHAAEARRHLRRLRAEHFIITGVEGGAHQDCRSLSGRLPALRAVLLQAADMAERYAAAAERTDCPELREVFSAFAADERRRARETRSLLIDSF